jgi:hypothetical protein
VKKLTFLGLVVFAAILLFASCERTEQVPAMKGIVAIEDIPMDYGELVSVTTDSHYPEWTQLWFADTTGTIRMVRVNWMEKTMLADVLIISRSRMAGGE